MKLPSNLKRLREEQDHMVKCRLFRDVLDEFGFMDLGFVGHMFT